MKRSSKKFELAQVDAEGWLGPLYHNQIFNAPVRAKKFDRIRQLIPEAQARFWEKNGIRRLYFADGTFLWCDETGLVRTTGGMATRVKLLNNLR